MKSLIDLLLSVRVLFKVSDCLFLGVDFLMVIFFNLAIYLIGTLAVILSDRFFLACKSAEGFLLVFGSFLLLIPPPLVDLGLRQPCSLRHLNDLFFAPVRLVFKSHFKNLQLSSTLSLSFLQPVIFF
jgi:hypothetical protein